MSRDIRRTDKQQKINICCREYFISDETILVDSTMLAVRRLKFLLENNIYFGNKILFLKEDIEKYKDFTVEKNGELFTENAFSILQKIEENSTYYQIVDVKEETSEIIQFLKENNRIILYTTNSELKETIEKQGLRCRVYKKQSKIDERFPHYVRYCTLQEVERRGGSNYLKPNKNIKVYSKNGKELKLKEVKLTLNDYIVTIHSQYGITKYTIYKVVNYHSVKNLIRIVWDETKNPDEQFLENMIKRTIKNV